MAKSRILLFFFHKSLILFIEFFFILHKAYVTCQNSLQDFKTEKHNLTVEIIFAIWYYL